MKNWNAEIAEFWKLDEKYLNTEQKLLVETCRPLYKLYFECTRRLYVDRTDCFPILVEARKCDQMLEFVKTSSRALDKANS